jgi:glycerol-3-phosphate acyltransferase PlsX
MEKSLERVLPIAVDCMGGDKGCGVVVRGAVEAWKALQIPFALVGDEKQLLLSLKKCDPERKAAVEIIHAPDVVSMQDSPSMVIRKKPKSSMRIAFNLVAEGRASSVVGPGNTGAMMGIGMYELGILPGLTRPAIASVIPRLDSDIPTVLLDSGANVDCRASQLVQFAVMGEIYARDVLSCQAPRIGLLSNGSEKSKGTDVTRAAAYLLESLDTIEYIGYVEGNDLHTADVVVCDGFVGNVLLKGMEGAVKLVVGSLKQATQSDWKARVGLWCARQALRRVFKEKLDPSAYGGAPLLGLKGVAIVAHGGSDWRAIMNALRVAHSLVQADVIDSLERAVSTLEPHVEIA